MLPTGRSPSKKSMQRLSAKRSFRCSDCGHLSLGWMGKCTECGSWDSYVEDSESYGKTRASTPAAKPARITEIELKDRDRLPTGSAEFDRVLGGGLVPGSLTLIGGEPGIGKSTLLLQIASGLSGKTGKILMVSGEESPYQIKMRARRLGVESNNLFVLSETNISSVCAVLDEVAPDLLFIDSVQTLFSTEIGSPPGSLAQVRHCSSEIFRESKTRSIATILIGHVTKDGSIAGPRTIEHLVDTVIYFEGDRQSQNRLVRAVKNRFGSTNEIAVFEMCADGLKEISDVSSIFLSGSGGRLSGRAISASLEGSKPLMIEIQSLVAPSNLAVPRRVSNGFDLNRLNLLIAVLEKRAGLPLSSKDVFLAVSGGIKTSEPASDLAVALSIASAVKDRPLKSEMAIFGEVSLGGEVKFARGKDLRSREAKRLGFSSLMLPESAATGKLDVGELSLIPVSDIIQAIANSFD